MYVAYCLNLRKTVRIWELTEDELFSYRFTCDHCGAPVAVTKRPAPRNTNKRYTRPKGSVEDVYVYFHHDGIVGKECPFKDFSGGCSESIVGSKQKENNPDYLYKLGLSYYYGVDVPQSYETAFKLLQRASIGGSIDAMCQLGHMYEYGEGVERSLESAIEYYKKPADNGDCTAIAGIQRCLEYKR